MVLGRGEGTLVPPGRPPSAKETLPAAPTGLKPGGDPVYVEQSHPISLAWRATGSVHHLQVLGFETDDVLMEKEVGQPPAEVSVPWPGLFRWRVASRDETADTQAGSGQGLR